MQWIDGCQPAFCRRAITLIALAALLAIPAARGLHAGAEGTLEPRSLLSAEELVSISAAERRVAGDADDYAVTFPAVHLSGDELRELQLRDADCAEAADRTVVAGARSFMVARLLDFCDIFTLDGGVGLGMTPHVQFTRWLQLGIGARLHFRWAGLLSPFWEWKRQWGPYLETSAELAFGPFLMEYNKQQGYFSKQSTEFKKMGMNRPEEPIYESERDFWAITLGYIGVIAFADAKLEFHPIEFMDFFAGWMGEDPANDDGVGYQPAPTEQPARVKPERRPFTVKFPSWRKRGPVEAASYEPPAYVDEQDESLSDERRSRFALFKPSKTSGNALKKWRDTDPAIFDWHDDVTRERSLMGLRTRKLGRGIINVFTGWVEIPKNMEQKWRETDPVTGAMLGFVQGCGWAIARTAVGFYEIGTFFWGAPNGYGPMMKPEFILPTIWSADSPLTDRIEID